MIAVTQSATISIMGVKTGAAANLITAGFMEKLLHVTITWLQWFVAAAPFAAIMTVALYFIMVKVMPPEVEHIPGGDEAIKASASELGPMSVPEKKLAAILIVLLGFWVTEGEFHHFDTAATTIAAVALMFLPGINILKWQPTQKRIAWGVIALTAIGVSLGTALLKMKAAGWMTNYVVGGPAIRLGLYDLRRDLTVHDRHPSRFLQRPGIGVDDDPGRHRRAARRPWSGCRCGRDDPATGLCRELRLRPAGQRPTPYDRARHRHL